MSHAYIYVHIRISMRRAQDPSLQGLHTENNQKPLVFKGFRMSLVYLKTHEFRKRLMVHLNLIDFQLNSNRK